MTSQTTFLLVVVMSSVGCRTTVAPAAPVPHPSDAKITSCLHVVVRDGETGMPIEAAHVGLTYFHDLPFGFLSPNDTHGFTNADGSTDCDPKRGAILYIEKSGYLGPRLVELPT